MSVHFVLLRVCVIGGTVSAFLNNTPVVAFFIPIMKELSAKYGFSVAEVMIPVSYAAILGGTCTLIGTSTNLVAIDLATKNIKDFKMGLFDMGRIGLPVMLAGSLYIIILAPIFFGGRRVKSAALDAPKRYAIAMRIGEGCDLIGKSLLSAKLLLSDDHVELLSALPAGGAAHAAAEGAALKAGDVLHVETPLHSIREVTGIRGLEFVQIARDPEVSARSLLRTDTHAYLLMRRIGPRRRIRRLTRRGPGPRRRIRRGPRGPTRPPVPRESPGARRPARSAQPSALQRGARARPAGPARCPTPPHPSARG